MPIVNEIEMARHVKGSGTALGGRRYFCEFCEKVRCRPLPFFWSRIGRMLQYNLAPSQPVRKLEHAERP